MNGQGELRLADAPAGTTLRYDLDAQIGGRIAGLGQRLVESSAKSITRQGLEGLARELALMTDPATEKEEEETAAAAAPAPPVTPAPPPSRPTQAEVAARVAGDVARDLVPAEKRPWVIGVGLALLAILAFLLARSCG
jgi:hypothetical protein